MGFPHPVRAAPVPWTEADLARLAQLDAAGWSYGRIAREMGRSPEAVRGKLGALKQSAHI